MREIETSNGIARIRRDREKGSRIIETNLPNIRGSFHECRLTRVPYIYSFHFLLPSIFPPYIIRVSRAIIVSIY